jgi:hypothetical protein
MSSIGWQVSSSILRLIRKDGLPQQSVEFIRTFCGAAALTSASALALASRKAKTAAIKAQA